MCFADLDGYTPEQKKAVIAFEKARLDWLLKKSLSMSTTAPDQPPASLTPCRAVVAGTFLTEQGK